MDGARLIAESHIIIMSDETEVKIPLRKGQIIVFKYDTPAYRYDPWDIIQKGTAAKVTRKAYASIKCCGAGGKALASNTWVRYHDRLIEDGKTWHNLVTVISKRHPMLKGMTEDEILSSKFVLSSDGDIIGLARSDGKATRNSFDLSKPTPVKSADFSSMRKMIERN